MRRILVKNLVKKEVSEVAKTNKRGFARVRLNEQELFALIRALDKVVEEFQAREIRSDYYKGLLRLRRKLVNRKRLDPLKARPLSQKQVIFLKPREDGFL